MPASGDVLLDTSVVIPYFRGEPVLRARFLASPMLYLPLTVLGELHCGANLSQNPAKNLAQIQNFLAAVVVLSHDSATAEYYGRISVSGNPAHADHPSITLATPFRRVEVP